MSYMVGTPEMEDRFDSGIYSYRFIFLSHNRKAERRIVMKKIFKTLGYAIGFLFGFCGASYAFNKYEEKKNRTYFTV